MSWDNYFDTVSAILTAEAVTDLAEASSSRKAANEYQEQLAWQVQYAQDNLNNYLRQVGCSVYYSASEISSYEVNKINGYKSKMERYISLGGSPSRIKNLDDLQKAIEQNEFLASKHMLSRQGEFEIIGKFELEQKLKEEEKEREALEKANMAETSTKLQLICRKQSPDPPDSFYSVDWRAIMGADYNTFAALRASLSTDPGNLDHRTRLSNMLDAHYDPKKLDRAGREAVSDLSDYYSIPLEILHATEDDTDYDITAIDPDAMLEERRSTRTKDEDRLEKLMNDLCTLCLSQSEEPPVPDNSNELKAALGSKYYEYLLYKDDFEKDRESMEIRRKIVRLLTDVIESFPSSGLGDKSIAILSDLADYYSLPIDLVFENPGYENIDINNIDINELLEQQISERAEIVNKVSAGKENLSEKIRCLVCEQPPDSPIINDDFNIKTYIGATNYTEFKECAEKLKKDPGDLPSRIRILQILSSFPRTKLKDTPLNSNNTFIAIYKYYSDPITLLREAFSEASSEELS